MTQESLYRVEEREEANSKERGRENEAMAMWRTAGALLLILHTGKNWFFKSKYTVYKYTK